jgi:hypothetical protein
MFGLVLGAHYERAFFAAIACLYLLLYATGFHSGRLWSRRLHPRIGVQLTYRDNDHCYLVRRFAEITI